MPIDAGAAKFKRNRDLVVPSSSTGRTQVTVWTRRARTESTSYGQGSGTSPFFAFSSSCLNPGSSRSFRAFSATLGAVRLCGH